MAKSTPSKTNRVRFVIFVLVGVLLMTSIITSDIPQRLREIGYGPTFTTITEPQKSPSIETGNLNEIAQIQLTVQPTRDISELSINSLVILSLTDGYFRHLFAYHPTDLPLTRITDGNWDDIQPAMYPNGDLIAFSSRKNGYWDIHIFNLLTGEQTSLTDTHTYDGAPSWSPDGQWIVYESYQNENLDILIQSVQDKSMSPIQLTGEPSADFNPSWSPGGRLIAFVSDRSGNMDIWLARLEGEGDRFINISQTPNLQENDPAWSPDGRYLVWSSNQNGTDSLFLWDSENPQTSPRLIGSGQVAAWNPDGNSILAGLIGPNQSYLSGYYTTTGTFYLPSIQLPGMLHGMDWNITTKKSLDVSGIYQHLNDNSNQYTCVAPEATTELGRFDIVALEDTKAPYPFLSAAILPQFEKSKKLIGEISGWDLLAELENAYVPITSPLSPGIVQDWHYTGRAISIPTAALQTGVLLACKEEISGLTYWRLFLKTHLQDGSQGKPITRLPWDFDARYSGDMTAYEQGGKNGSLPSGYWIDLTDVLSTQGWERLPADRSWRTYYPASHFNEFVITDELTWQEAMTQLYPPEALVTPTFVPTALITSGSTNP